MGDSRAFMTVPRVGPLRRPVAQRLSDWREIYERQAESETALQATRCMDCGVPFCLQGCPLGNLIPDWNTLVSESRWQEAWAKLSATNNFPEFTGRICPAPCESACTLAINADAVTIEAIEKEISEHAWGQGWPTPHACAAPTGKRVAVVGSGPAGLAAAEQLAVAGHEVTVFERDERVGGLLRFGIPDFKLEKWVIDRRVALIASIGVVFRTSSEVGVDVHWDELRADFDAVLIAVGAMRARELDVPGRNLEGVHLAMEYLTAQNRATAAGGRSGLDARGKHIVVLGGGDTGSDCVGTAHRQGAASVTQIEILARPPVARDPANPWPQWPMVFRTSSSQEEGGEREFALRTTELRGNGSLSSLQAERVEVRSDAGAFAFLPTGEVVTFDCDILLLALGFVGPNLETAWPELGLDQTARGTVAADEFSTNVPGIYTAGDAMRGASLVVWAISDGREAARAIDADLRAGQSHLPSRGDDQPFGGR